MIDTVSKQYIINLLVTLWTIWKARRKVINEDLYESHLYAHAFVIQFLANLEVVSNSKKWKGVPFLQKDDVVG